MSFFGTAKSGLGHLRRLSAIAARVKAQQRYAELSLITNAKPAELGDADLRVFTGLTVCDRQDMADWLLQ